MNVSFENFIGDSILSVKQCFQKGVNTRNGFPDLFGTVCGSCSKALLKLFASTPDFAQFGFNSRIARNRPGFVTPIPKDRGSPGHLQQIH